MDQNLYILGILEGKINESFHAMCFSLSAFHRPYRLDVPGKKKRGLVVRVKSTLSTHQVIN